jgi:HD-GYP domain-containing protein (c-di-GMP phosphodiesterase class II)
MAQIILIEDNKVMNDLISVNLNTYLGADIIIRNNAQDALNLLAILPNIDLIITKFSIELEETSKILETYITSNKLPIGLIILGGEVNISSEYSLGIPNDLDWESVVHNAAKMLGINESVFVKKSTPDYIPIPSRYLLNLESINCDIFIRIKKSPTESQYIKRIHQGESFSKDVIKRYIAQGLEYFHVPKEHYKNFTIFLSNKLVEKIEKTDVEVTQKIQLMGESYEIAIKEIVKLGFTSESIQLTESIIQSMVKIFEKSPEMSNLLHKLINSKTGVLYQRCHMTSVVSSEILKNLNVEDKGTYVKMAYASFFHDIILAENENVSKINSFEELEREVISEEIWDLVFNHAIDASTFLRKHPEAPTGVDEIIKHHHGASNGKGFSINIDKLPDLSKIFIIAHEFVLELVKYKENGGDAKPIVEGLYKKYPSPEATIIIKALEKTLKKKKNLN